MVGGWCLGVAEIGAVGARSLVASGYETAERGELWFVGATCGDVRRDDWAKAG